MPVHLRDDGLDLDNAFDDVERRQQPPAPAPADGDGVGDGPRPGSPPSGDIMVLLGLLIKGLERAAREADRIGGSSAAPDGGGGDGGGSFDRELRSYLEGGSTDGPLAQSLERFAVASLFHMQQELHTMGQSFEVREEL